MGFPAIQSGYMDNMPYPNKPASSFKVQIGYQGKDVLADIISTGVAFLKVDLKLHIFYQSSF